MFDIGGQEDLDSRVARCIFACRIPFDVFRSPYWNEVLTVDSKPKRCKATIMRS
jgi:hypothetical protein